MAHIFFRADKVEKDESTNIFKISVPPFASPGSQLIALLLSFLLPLESNFLRISDFPGGQGRILGF